MNALLWKIPLQKIPRGKYNALFTGPYGTKIGNKEIGNKEIGSKEIDSAAYR